MKWKTTHTLTYVSGKEYWQHLTVALLCLSLIAVPDSGQCPLELSRTAPSFTHCCPGQRPACTQCCPGQRWVTNKAKQLLNVVSTLSPRHTSNSFSFHDTVLSKLQCHKIFKIPFCITIWSSYSQTSRIMQVLQMQLSDTGRCPGQCWVTQNAVRDSAEWNWTLSGTALNETGRCLRQLWVKLGAVRDSSEWF